MPEPPPRQTATTKRRSSTSPSARPKKRQAHRPEDAAQAHQDEVADDVAADVAAIHKMKEEAQTELANLKKASAANVREPKAGADKKGDAALAAKDKEIAALQARLDAAAVAKEVEGEYKMKMAAKKKSQQEKMEKQAAEFERRLAESKLEVKACTNRAETEKADRIEDLKQQLMLSQSRQMQNNYQQPTFPYQQQHQHQPAYPPQAQHHLPYAYQQGPYQYQLGYNHQQGTYQQPPQQQLALQQQPPLAGYHMVAGCQQPPQQTGAYQHALQQPPQQEVNQQPPYPVQPGPYQQPPPGHAYYQAPPQLYGACPQQPFQQPAPYQQVPTQPYAWTADQAMPPSRDVE